MRRLAGVSILIVDDEPEIRMILKDVFEFEGALVWVASGGRIALDTLRQRPFDVVLSDLCMAEGDGLNLLEDIRVNIEQAPPVFIYSGCVDGDLQMAKDLGAVHVFTKPLDDEAIVLGIVQALDKKGKLKA